MSAPTHACPCGCGQQLRQGLLVCPDGWWRLPQEFRDPIITAQRQRASGISHAGERHRQAVRAAKSWFGQHSPTAAQGDAPGYDTGRCDACKAPIIWAVTATGQRVCVDAAPVALDGGQGDTTLTPRGPGLPPLASVARNPAGLFGARRVYRRHIQTCPYRDRYRAAARRRGHA